MDMKLYCHQYSCPQLDIGTSARKQGYQTLNLVKGAQVLAYKHSMMSLTGRMADSLTLVWAKGLPRGKAPPNRLVFHRQLY